MHEFASFYLGHELASFYRRGKWGEVYHEPPMVPGGIKGKSIRKEAQLLASHTRFGGGKHRDWSNDNGTIILTSVQRVPRDKSGTKIHPTRSR